MVTQALAILAETIRDEGSKAPFYALGGALAVWAVVLAGLGLTRPAFPDGDLQMRAVVGVSLVLVAGTMITAVATA